MRATVIPLARKCFSNLRRLCFAAAVGKCDQCMHEHSALHRINQRALDLGPVETEDHDFNAFFGLLNAFDQTLHAIPGLNK